MGMMSKARTAWKIYQTVRSVTKRNAPASVEETSSAVGKLLGALRGGEQGSSEPALAVPEVAVPEVAGDLSLSSAGKALARPVLRRVKRMAIKAGVTVAVVGVGATAGRLYLRHKFNI